MNQNVPSVTTILLVEPDDTVRPILKDNLHRWGYAVIVTLDAADALQRTRDGGALFNLILMNQVGRSLDEFVASGRYIRQQAAVSDQIPIVVLAEEYEVELEGQDVQVGEAEYVSYLEDGEQLKKLLCQLCPVQPN